MPPVWRRRRDELEDRAAVGIADRGARAQFVAAIDDAFGRDGDAFPGDIASAVRLTTWAGRSLPPSRDP